MEESSSSSQTLIFLINNLYYYRNLVKLFKLLQWLPEPLPTRNRAGCPVWEEHEHRQLIKQPFPYFLVTSSGVLVEILKTL